MAFAAGIIDRNTNEMSIGAVTKFVTQSDGFP